jgi:hypothetical protein
MTIIALTALTLMQVPAVGLQDTTTTPVQAQEDQHLLRNMREQQLLERILPSAMHPARLKEMTTTLELDGKSLETWSSMVEQYLMEWERLGSAEARRARELKTSSYDWDDQQQRFIPRPVMDLVMLEETTSRLRELVRQIDDALFENLPLLVSEDQVDTVHGIIHRRALERDLRPSTIAGSQTDITKLVDELPIQEENLEAIKAWGKTYQSEFRDAIAIHARIVDRDRRMFAEELVELGPLPEHDVLREYIDLVEIDRSDRRFEIFEMEITLQRLNQKHIKRVRSMLPPAISLKLLRAWQISMGGAYLGEQGQLVELIERIITEPGLDDRSKEAILSIPDEIVSRNELLDALIIEQETRTRLLSEQPTSAERDALLLTMHSEKLESYVKRRRTLVDGIQTMLGILSNDVPEMTSRLVALEAELEARIESDLELAERSRTRALSIDDRLAWEAMEAKIRDALEARTGTEESVPVNDEEEDEDR